MLRTVGVFLLLSALFFSCRRDEIGQSKKKTGNAMDIGVRSTAFTEGEMIPKNYTCDGENISPPLAWTSVPEGTKSIALICDDPDAPRGTFVHWVLFNLPPDMRELPEALPATHELENGARHGINGSGKAGYRGPCPPGGVHRYYFRLYALDIQLTLPSGVEESQLVEAMEGHILGRGQLMGRYKR